MSERQHSRASVVRVKGVSFNYLQFLWSQIGQVRTQQIQNNFAGAMALLGSLITYLPDSIKDKFRDDIVEVVTMMDRISLGQLPEIQKIPDYYIRGLYRNKLLQNFANEALTELVDSLSTELNKLGYMENLKVVAEGEADIEQDWIHMDKKRKAAEKRRKKTRTREASPTGQIEDN